MTSEFRRKKLLHVFNAFFDTDESGTIDRRDFANLIAKATSIKGEHYRNEAESTLYKIWEGLQSTADKDNDGRVTIEEWFDMWNKYAAGAKLDWQADCCKFIFQLEDSSGDGSIDMNEFSSVYKVFGIDVAESTRAFKKLSPNSAPISWDAFQKLWHEYFTSEDASSPGNFIFGKCDF